MRSEIFKKILYDEDFSHINKIKVHTSDECRHMINISISFDVFNHETVRLLQQLCKKHNINFEWISDYIGF